MSRSRAEIEKLDSMLPINGGREWRDVPGFEGLYVVSSDGYVGSLSREVPTSGGRVRTIRTRILKPVLSKKNGKIVSCCVHLNRDGKLEVNGNIGRLVLISFNGFEEGKVAHYKDSNPTNNSLSNMEWSTPAAIEMKVAARSPYRRNDAGRYVAPAEGCA